MKDYIPPEQLLSRILHIAQLLTYTESSSLNAVHTDQDAEPATPTIIVGKNDSSENVEKLCDEEKM